METAETAPYAVMAELLDSVNVGLCLFDADDHALLWNRTFLTLFPEHDGHIHVGEHYADNLRRFYLCRLGPDELPLIDHYIAEGVARHRNQSQPFVFEHRGQWIRVAAMPAGTSGGTLGRVRVWTPLAAPTGASQWQRPTAARTQADDAFMEHVADGVMLLDADGRISSANEQVLFLYDVPRKPDLIGLRYEELLHRVWRGDGSRLSATLAERQRFPGAPFEVELPNDRWLRVVEQRGVDGIAYSTHVDITAMKRLQCALNRAKEDADRANAAKSRFLAMISHEIRTPMNAVIGIGRIALKSTREPRLRGYLETINASAGRLLGIINDLLDFSKIEAGKVDIASQPFTLDEVLEPLCDLMAGSAPTDRIEVVIRVAPNTPTRLVGDPLRLGQVLANLTGNALKFTERGEILVTVEETARAAGQVTLNFTVADTGIGIDAAQQAQLFQPFVQADDTTTRRYGGTGLGLTICKQLVELMGGSITVASALGDGSRFSFAVDLGLAEPVEPASPPLTGRILVVDDHPTARAALVEMVTALGHEALEAASGPAALLAVELAAKRGEPVTAALVDWRMPGWDGAETIERLRTNGRAARIPVLPMIPANAPGDGFRPGRGGTGLLFKPVSPGRLGDRLAELLDSGGKRPAKLPAKPRDLSCLHGARVLLVDDNAINRDVALHLLAEAKITVDVAEDGAQAVERVRQGDYDLVLMDIQMPVMDGLEATRRIRAFGRYDDLPIVAMTAQAMSNDRQASHDAGLNDHLNKPIEPDRLFDAMIRLIDPDRLAGRVPAPRRGASGDRAAWVPGPDWSGWEQAGLDWENALQRVDGDPAVLCLLLRTFRQSHASYPQELQDAVATGKSERIRFLAHALRSSAAYIGAMEVSDLAGRADGAVRARQFGMADGLAIELATTLAQLLDRLSGLLPAQAPADAPPVTTPDSTAETLEPAIRRLAELLNAADLRAEDVWGELRDRLGPPHRDFAAVFGSLLDDLCYGDALDQLHAFAAPLGIALVPPQADSGDADLLPIRKSLGTAQD